MGRALRALSGASLLTAFVFTHARARADDSSTPLNDRAAEAAYREAQAKYAKDDLAGALERMTESYRLSQRPELLYNLALLEQQLQNCHQSQEDYAQYLDRVPHGQHRSEAQRASEELKLACPAANTTTAEPPPPHSVLPVVPVAPSSPPPPVAAPPTPAPRANRSDSATLPIIGWSAITAGALAGGSALYFTFAARSARDEYQQSVDAQLRGGPLRDPHLEAEQHRDQTAARVLAVSGSALLTGGVLLLLLSPRHHDADAVQASLHVQPGGFEARYSLRF